MSLEQIILEYTKKVDEYHKVISPKQSLNIFPDKSKLFLPFKLTPLDKIKVVILGQDPYFKKGLATGLAFGVPLEMKDKLPPSLSFIFNSLKEEYGPFINTDCTLTSWANQGVLLLNTSLTVIENQPNSHTNIWRPFTEMIIDTISNKCNKIVFMLWGSNARSFTPLIENKGHLIITKEHPVVGKFNFKGGFREANNFLESNHNFFVDW